jgi:hypothetical protein
MFTVLEAGDNRHSSMQYVPGWRVGCEKVACGTGVEDGPSFDGFGVDINHFEKD